MTKVAIWARQYQQETVITPKHNFIESEHVAFYIIADHLLCTKCYLEHDSFIAADCHWKQSTMRSRWQAMLLPRLMSYQEQIEITAIFR